MNAKRDAAKDSLKLRLLPLIYIPRGGLVGHVGNTAPG